ncbi:protein of unknown function [Taphrina deformans PYCC 5710]|uniref:Rhamnolipids biosynthesis 3-oxoacyl-[acyl-carrier-protein] reductase n=1 Tax=Taphrina deformans (strain PYCC 5710 / ATCC 11124 / CBS 356.35 / IMI 108563 / JCM 9778 / NBRC 8474) TaxID=1097556 RepID=R4XGF8_TAPDE|nr:protein of unknown function [Taphrina deformans PYCC 5710]|eukprot:CCG84727.1 protein of unknown function [Taphrina deformans PYCC 5710]
MDYDYSITQVPDLFNVKGKVALITGGSSGLGLNMAHGLVRNGCKVYISSRKQAQCDAAVKELSKYGEAIAIACDASKKENLDKLAAFLTEKEQKGIHFCIANAGATWGESIDKHSPEAFSKVMDLNVKSVFYTVQVMLPLLERAATKADPARVITTGSVAGLRVSSEKVIPYSTSKAAVHHMIRNMSVALGPRNITCNAIAPGMFPSKMTRGTLKEEAALQTLVEGNPMGRLGEPRDIIGVCLFLCSPAAAYVNGIVVPLDGAAYMGGSRI